MPASFTWLDYSETQRRKMLDVIDAFREKETRDELGLSSIRDGFADQFFPGTSTIQTRARYFFFIPWIYLRLERERVRSSEIARYARRDEVQLIEALLQGGEVREGDGVIGRIARSALQRLPSSVYWQGLGAWGLRRFPGSQDQYHRSLDRFYALARHRRHSRAEGDDLLDEPMDTNWHQSLPEPPADFLKCTSFALTSAEAAYLSERIRLSTPGSLLAFLLDAGFDPITCDFPWEHPHFAEFPQRLTEPLTHARAFSETMHGAPLLYNLMLAELTDNVALIDQYRAWLADWSALITPQLPALAHWDRQRFWAIVTANGARITPPTRHFVEAWITAIRSPGVAATIAEQPHLRQLVQQREIMLKRQLSRLNNPRARELWNGQSGTGRLDFRWRPAQRLLGDLFAAQVAR